MISKFISLFPVWAIIVSVFSYYNPGMFTEFKPAIIPLLAVVMFCMGVTLTVEDFFRAFKKPKVIVLTVILQFTIMPLAAFLISKMLGFSVDLLAGMVLVGSVSGGTASNVIAYISKADVALSITLTAVSTILSVVITPFLTLFYIGQCVSVPALSMLLSILKLVLIPVLLGLLVNHFFYKKISKIKDVFALFSIISIVFIISIVVSLNVNSIKSVGVIIFAGVILHNAVGLTGGYFGAKFLGYDRKICKTVAVEVGMQNSGLAVALASKYFSSLSMLPGAIFSIWHNISGSILAGYWSKDEG